MISFACNICGFVNALEEIPWETSTCSGCRSNVRMRALIHLLSVELYGQPLTLTRFPANKQVRGCGLSDDLLYAVPLAKKFDFTNTFYDREPYLDLTATHPEQYGTYDFILSSDVFEHIAPPVERAFDEACRLLKPNGFLCITVPSSPADGDTVEYYPDLFDYSIVDVDGERLLVNRKKDGTTETHRNLEFHGGIGATLLMREFTQKDLARKLKASGFSDVIFQTEHVARNGILLHGTWALPLVARKERYAPLLTAAQLREVSELELQSMVEISAAAAIAESGVRITQLRSENAALARAMSELEQRLRLAQDSRWLRFGNFLGLGPRLR